MSESNDEEIERKKQRKVNEDIEVVRGFFAIKLTDENAVKINESPSLEVYGGACNWDKKQYDPVFACDWLTYDPRKKSQMQYRGNIIGQHSSSDKSSENPYNVLSDCKLYELYNNLYICYNYKYAWKIRQDEYESYFNIQKLMKTIREAVHDEAIFHDSEHN